MSDEPGDPPEGSSDRPDADAFDWNDGTADATGAEGTDVTDTGRPDGTDVTDTGRSDGTDVTDTDRSDGTDADPFAELEAETRSVEGDPFERMAVDEVDVDAVWDALDGDLDAVDESEEFPAADPRETTEHVVDKRKYCHRCPHFAAPPDTACTHEGTSILEAIGFDEFRVRDCPMVTDEGPGFDRRG